MQLHLCGAEEGWYDVDEKDTDHFGWKLEGFFFTPNTYSIGILMVSSDHEVKTTSCFLSISMTDNKTAQCSVWWF